jgi:hypothetical protein
MAVSFAGLRLKSDCSGKVQKQLYSKLQTHPHVREGATEITNPQLSEGNFMEKEKLVAGARWVADNIQTGRLTVGRKLTSSLHFSLHSRF